MKTRHQIARTVLVCAALLSTYPAFAQFTQQGTKLLGTGTTQQPSQGNSVRLSADGNTAIVGAPTDSGTGSAFIWTRSGGVWSQQGNKLVGSGAVGNAEQGNSVAISADGNTAIVGGYFDNDDAGAAWIWTKSGGVWTQQGSKLVGSGGVGPGFQGNSVSISADGNTAIVGAGGDDNSTGAMWVWVRSGGVWSQQGAKLTGSGASPGAGQGIAVSLSGDGNTAIIGGDSDGAAIGAAWVFTRSGGVWSQQGNKLVGFFTSGTAGSRQGHSVAISADGNTAIVGGSTDNNFNGAAWVWTRSGGVWTQQGNKLFGTGAVGTAAQGISVAISADGNIALVGGASDSNRIGATWVWTRSGGVWSQQGFKVVGANPVGTSFQGISVSLSADGNTAMIGGNSDDGGLGAAWGFLNSPDLTIVKSHTRQFQQGDNGNDYTITVSNTRLAQTAGVVTVTDTVPAGLTPTAPNGTFDGWTCLLNGQTLTCTTSDVLAGGASYPPITLLVDVANDASPSVTNTAAVSGGGELNTANDTSSDVTPIKAIFLPVTPTGVTASAVSTSRIDIVWTAVPGAASYETYRRAAGSGFLLLGTSVTNSYSDTTVSSGSSYLYSVRALNGAGNSNTSAPDLATTVFFLDSPLTPGIRVKAAHLSQLRPAVNAVRLLAGLLAATFTDDATSGVTIRAVHLTELRSNLDAARAALGLSTSGYTDNSLNGVAVKSIHWQELRNRIQ
jgi:uncharacterized repeat protein (TIGR01451 family)